MEKAVKTLDSVARRIAEVQHDKTLLIYSLCEIINEIAREVEVDMRGCVKLSYSDKHSLNQIKMHSDRLSIGAGRVMSEEKAMRFGEFVDTIKPMIYEGLELPENTRDLIEN